MMSKVSVERSEKGFIVESDGKAIYCAKSDLEWAVGMMIDCKAVQADDAKYRINTAPPVDLRGKRNEFASTVSAG